MARSVVLVLSISEAPLLIKQEFHSTDSAVGYFPSHASFRRTSNRRRGENWRCRARERLMPDQHIGTRNAGKSQYRIKHLPLEKARTEAL